MSLHAERMVAPTGWEGPLIKPWHIVANAKKLVEDDVHIRIAFLQGATHIWVRYIGYKLIINAYNMESDEPRLPVDSVIKGKGFWFAQSRSGLFHCLPVRGDLPKTLLTIAANVDY